MPKTDWPEDVLAELHDQFQAVCDHAEGGGRAFARLNSLLAELQLRMRRLGIGEAGMKADRQRLHVHIAKLLASAGFDVFNDRVAAIAGGVSVGSMDAEEWIEYWGDKFAADVASLAAAEQSEETER